MTKRPAGSDGNPPPKRQKIKTPSTTNTVLERERHEIHSSRDLQVLLAFSQDVGPVSRQKIQSFKLFLASIAYTTESDDRSAKRQLLLDYLQSQASSDRKGASGFLGDVVKTWHFAAQSNADSLFASVIDVFALLLKTISSFIDFRDHGNRICTIVLHDEQLKLLDKGLGTHGAKDFIISPCLQLLTEVVVFDGGHAAGTLYRQREVTFKRLDAFLGMRNNDQGTSVKSRRRRSVREKALGYLFANLRLQKSAAKMNIIIQGKVVRALLDDIAEDSFNVVLEMLEVLKQEVAMDSAIPHTAKSRFFNQWTLSRLTTLYGYNGSVSPADSHQEIQRSLHEFLLLLCTSPDCGLVEIQPPSDFGVLAVMHDKTSVCLLQRDVSNKPGDKTRLARKHPRLQQFLQTLRPYASVPQCNLILEVFRNLPELIPDYFSSGKTFSFDPKLTTTWIGYSSFILAVIAIPLPEFFTTLSTNGAQSPLHGAIMENIIPKPCTQKAMTRGLNQGVDLVKFLTLQVLNAAFEKFAKVLQVWEHNQHHTDNQDSKSVWRQGVSQLRDDFCLRVPELRHVISQFRSCPEKSTVLRGSSTRLIALYYKVIPQVALQEIFDISIPLSIALIDIKSSDENQEKRGMRLHEFGHLLDIAHRSPNMQWWHKPESMRLSPFTMLLGLYLDCNQAGIKSKRIGTLLNTVMAENHILRSNAFRAPLNGLTLSLSDFKTLEASSQVFEFLDHCILRLVKKPVHYYDLLANTIGAAELDIHPSFCQIDLLMITLMDQWHFLVESADALKITNVSEWLVRYIEGMNSESGYIIEAPLRDEITKLLSQIRDQLKSDVQESTCRARFEKALKEQHELRTLKEFVAADTTRETDYLRALADAPLETHLNLELVLPPGPPAEREDHPGLHQWTRHEIEDAISDGHVKALVLCLCSKYAGIREQALTSIRAFMKKLEVSSYSERQQTYMLVGEILETARNVSTDGPLAYYAGVLAASLFLVLSDPLHFMYAKVNGFLNRGPEWNVRKLPSYWVDKIIMNPPTDDDSHIQEAEWLLDGLIDGLRTSADMEIYRKCHIFERLLLFSASLSLPEPCFHKILDLLFRCTYVEGSSTLITRCGLMSWIFSCLASHTVDDQTAGRLRMLASRVYETSDEERINDWANGTMRCTVDYLEMSQRR